MTTAGNTDCVTDPRARPMQSVMCEKGEIRYLQGSPLAVPPLTLLSLPNWQFSTVEVGC